MLPLDGFFQSPALFLLLSLYLSLLVLQQSLLVLALLPLAQQRVRVCSSLSCCHVVVEVVLVADGALTLSVHTAALWGEREQARVLEHLLLQVAWVFLGHDCEKVQAFSGELVQFLLRCALSEQLAP